MFDHQESGDVPIGPTGKPHPSDVVLGHLDLSLLFRDEEVPDSGNKAGASAVEFTRCFLRLANLPNFALDQLSRYETNLWFQASRILYALETLDRRKPQEQSRRFSFANEGSDRY